MKTGEKSLPHLKAGDLAWASGAVATASYAATRQAKEKATIRNYVPYLTFTLCATLYLLPFMRVLLQRTDEGTLIYGAVRIIHGQVFARDFFEVVGPGTFYWLAMFFKLFGTTFLATRICLLLTSLGTGLVVYFLSRKVCRTYCVLPCLLVAGTSFGMLWPAISHHVDSNLFALLSVACMVLWSERHNNAALIAAGVLAGATTCFLQTKGILLLASILLWLWIQKQRRAAPISALTFFLGGYLAVVTFVLGYFGSRGALRDLAYANAVWPSGHYGPWNLVPYAYGLIRNYWDLWAVTKSGAHWTVAMALVLITPLLLVVAQPGLLLILGAWRRNHTLKPEIVLYLLCGWALWLSELHRKDIYHLVFGSPLLIILCVSYLEDCRAKVTDLALQMLAITAACLACFNFFLVLSARPMATRVGSVAIFKSDPVLTFLDQHVSRGEEVFAYPYCPMYYFLSATTNPTRYSLLIYNYNTSSQFREVIQVLEERRVKYVVWDKSFQSKAIAGIFSRSAFAPTDSLIIEPYLESHYKLLRDEGGVRVMERRAERHAD
jgi:Dolichyl-phosphate-mannose-protein mannosyltransferase